MFNMPRLICLETSTPDHRGLYLLARQLRASRDNGKIRVTRHRSAHGEEGRKNGLGGIPRQGNHPGLKDTGVQVRGPDGEGV